MTSPLFLGIEIGGTKLQIGLGDAEGRLLKMSRLAVETKAGSAGIREQIAREVPRLVTGGGSGRIEAVGIGFGGPVDPERGVVITSYQIDGWEEFPLAAWVRETLGVPRVSLQNDADTAALGEARSGAGVGLSPVLYVTVGSGIGGGLVIDGRIYRGSGRGAVEIGHLWIDEPGETGPRGLGPKVSLQEVASGWGIGERARRAAAGRDRDSSRELIGLAGGEIDAIDARAVAEAASRGDRLGSGILGDATRAMAEALAHAVTLLAPRRIILGGGVSLVGEELWFGPIRRQLDERVFAPFRGTFDVVPASLGEAVVIHGALALAVDEMTAQHARPTSQADHPSPISPGGHASGVTLS